MDVIKFMQEKMIYITLILIGISGYAGLYYHNTFLLIKWTLPLSLFLMLLKPMVYMDIKKAFTSINPLKAKYIALVTAFYVGLFPALTYGFMKIFLYTLPMLDPRIIAALVIIGLAPIASAAPAFVGMSGGRVQLALIGVIWTFILSVVVIPFYGSAILHTVISVPVWLLFKAVLLYVVVPLAAGQVVRYLTLYIKGDKGLKAISRPLSFLSLLGLYWMVVEVFGINANVVAKMSMPIIIATALMYIYHLIRFGISYYTGKGIGFPIDRNISLVYSSTVNMTMATAVAIGTFGPLAGVGTIFAGPFSEMILMILFVRVMRKLAVRESEEKLLEKAEEKISPLISNVE